MTAWLFNFNDLICQFWCADEGEVRKGTFMNVLFDLIKLH